MVEKLNPLLKLLKTASLNNGTLEFNDTFDSVNKALSDACELTLKQPLPGEKRVLLTDGSLRSSGYALMIGYDPVEKLQSKWRI